jgi:hypothetical protein
MSFVKPSDYAITARQQYHNSSGFLSAVHQYLELKHTSEYSLGSNYV